MNYTLLVGVHGVGKTTFLEGLKQDLDIVSLSISDLIRQAGNDISKYDKFTKNIDDNQILWKKKLEEYNFSSDKIVILDGHLSLLDESKNIIELPFSIFDEVNIVNIIVKSEDPNIIKSRLEKRDGEFWDVALIKKFQETEIKRALDFSKQMNIPLFEVSSELNKDDLIKFLKY